MKSLEDLINDLKQTADKFEQFQKQLPRLVGTTAVNHSRDNFKKQGYEGNKWKRRKEGSPRNTGRAILVDTGTLKDSIRYWIVSEAAVLVGVDQSKVPYAQIHNEGGTIKITSKMRKFFWVMHNKTGEQFWKGLALTKKTHITIPKRQYLGVTKELDNQIKTAIEYYVKQILKTI